jgi:hypothetical protein
MAAHRPKLRIGLLVPTPIASRHVAELLQWAAGSEGLAFEALIVASAALPGEPAAPARRALGERLRALVFRAVIRCEQRLLDLARKTDWRIERRALAPLLPQRVDVAFAPRRTGDHGPFDDADVARISALGLDLLIAVDLPRIAGAMLSAARLGVLEVVDAVDPRADPADLGREAFHEARTRADSTPFGVRLAQPSAAGDAWLARGACATAPAYLLNRAGVVRKTFAVLRLVLERAARDGALPAATVEARNDPGARLPGARESIGYLAAWLGRMAVKAALRRLKFEHRWHVSYARAGWQDLDPRTTHPLPWLRGRFLADPFVIEREGRTCLFVEDYVYRTGLGHITVFELAADGMRELGICLQEPFHLSFPYLFEYEGQLYMCPETYQARQVRVYRCDEFPLRWSLASVAMPDIDAADPMLFARDGRWWLLLNRDYAGDGDYGWALDLYSGDSPLGSQWTPHPRNPVSIDSICARNGGMLVDGMRRYRCAQRQGYDVYGRGLSIREIEELSAERYRERLVRTIEPDFRTGLIGVHHMHSTGRVTVIDHQSWSYIG